jgi:hypothetical protein
MKQTYIKTLKFKEYEVCSFFHNFCSKRGEFFEIKFDFSDSVLKLLYFHRIKFLVYGFVVKVLFSILNNRIHLRNFFHSGNELRGNFAAIEFELFQKHIDLGDDAYEILYGFGGMQCVEQLSDF